MPFQPEDLTEILGVASGWTSSDTDEGWTLLLGAPPQLARDSALGSATRRWLALRESRHVDSLD